MLLYSLGLLLLFCMCFDLFLNFMVHSPANMPTSKTKFYLFSKLSSLVCSQGNLYGIKLFLFDTKNFVLPFVLMIRLSLSYLKCSQEL